MQRSNLLKIITNKRSKINCVTENINKTSMSVSIPKSLTSYGEILKRAESLKQKFVESIRLLPNNQSAAQVQYPDISNSIDFKIPIYSKSCLLSTEESFVQNDFQRTQLSGIPGAAVHDKLAD